MSSYGKHETDVMLLWRYVGVTMSSYGKHETDEFSRAQQVMQVNIEETHIENTWTQLIGVSYL